jgi:Fusaric acid resistance protein-like
LVSTLFVSWFPALDAASVIEKVIQRSIGTCIGATIGLSFGFISIIVYHEEQQLAQSIFLGICLFVGTFFIVFSTGQYKVGGKKVMTQFPHATLMCVITFCISMLPFGSSKTHPKWKAGVSRVIYVFAGCIMGAIGSIILFPKSTNDVLFERTAKQVKLAGTAAESLLQTAAEYFSGGVNPTRLTESLLNAPIKSSIRWKFKRSNSGLRDDNTSVDLDVNIAMKKYEDAIMDWRATKALLPIVKYDPFAVQLPTLPLDDKMEPLDYKGPKVHVEIAKTLSRALRIQTTIVVLDGMLRKDAMFDFTHDQLFLFSSIGKLIKEMLTVPLKLELTDDAARQLFDKLEDVKRCIMIESSKVAEGMQNLQQRRHESIQRFKKCLLVNNGGLNDIVEDDEGRGIPKNATCHFENTLFFLELVEHLILRSLRLYQAWKQVENESK